VATGPRDSDSRFMPGLAPGMMFFVQQQIISSSPAQAAIQ
jgi:hypothetical protein